MFNFKKRDSGYSVILDQYEADSEKDVFANEEHKNEIRDLIWRNTQKNINRDTRRASSWLYYSAAASILLALTVVLLYRSAGIQNENIQWTYFQNTTNHIQKIWLPDSSSVFVQRGGSIAWSSDFNSLSRTILLRSGECFFDVRKQNGRPFTVVTDSVRIKVLGTSFLVKNDSASRRMCVSVMTGKVQVSRNDQVIKVLHPQEHLSVDQRTWEYAQKLVPSSDLAMWQQEKIVLREIRIYTIADYLSRFFNVSISMDAALERSDEKYTFIFSSASGFSDVMDILETIAPAVRCRKINDKSWEWHYTR